MEFSQKVNEMPIRTKLAEIMEKRDIKRMDIVRGADVSYPTVVRWENSDLKRLDPVTVAKLKKFLDVSDSELYEVYDE